LLSIAQCSFSAGLAQEMSKLSTQDAAFFDLDDDEGWEDMPVVRDDDFAGGLDDEDKKKYHYKAQDKKDGAPQGSGNATGTILDVDAHGQEWRANAEVANEGEYTRLRVREEDESDEVHLRTRYLFDEDKAMTPLSQMQQTKNLLTEAQRVAYVGLCALTAKAMADNLRSVNSKELKACIQNMELWALKILGRLYYHMELATAGMFRLCLEIPSVHVIVSSLRYELLLYTFSLLKLAVFCGQLSAKMIIVKHSNGFPANA
jgi:hypothetical protein